MLLGAFRSGTTEVPPVFRLPRGGVHATSFLLSNKPVIERLDIFKAHVCRTSQPHAPLDL